MNIIKYLVFSLFLFVTTRAQCNATLLQFHTEYSLGRQDQLNRTFIQIQERVSTLDNVTYESDATIYKLYNIKPKYHYIDSSQKAHISEDTNLVIVLGGYLNVEYQFDWSKSSGSGGSGRAQALSDSIGFTKQIKLNTTYAFQELFDYQHITFHNKQTNISRIDPPNILQQDLQALTKMLNVIDGTRTVKTEIQEQIDKVYSYYLNLSLYQEKRIIDQFFEYKWKGPSSSISIQYEIEMVNITFVKEGITTRYMEKIANYSEWKCDHDVPDLILSPRVYGSQEFMTFDIFKNTFKYAIDNGALNTDLNRKNWESRFFQFFAGDLYEVIPKLSETYYAAEPVMGSCKVNDSQHISITRANHDSFNVSMNTLCQLGIGRQKIAGFNLTVFFEVQLITNPNSIDFVVRDFNFSANYEHSQKFVIENNDLANHMIQHSLNRIKNDTVLGSGWPLYPRDYPHIIVADDYVIIYDSTHIDPDQLIE